MKRRLIQLTGLLALFLALFLLPSFLKAQVPPICLPPGVGITCENCTPDYIVKYSDNNTLVNSPFYVNPNNNFIGYNTTDPGVPLQISADNPRISLEFPNIKTFTFGLNQGIGSGKAFYFADNTNSAVRLLIHNEGSIEGGSFISHWLKLNPKPSEPFPCTQDQEGAVYWKESEGLYCCLNNQWQLCSGSTTPPPPSPPPGDGDGGGGGGGDGDGGGPVCGNGSCEAGEDANTCPQDCGGGGPVCGNGVCEADENANNCPQDCVEGGGEASGDVKVNNSDGPISVQAGQSVTVSWNITCTGDYYDPRVVKRVNNQNVGRIGSGASGSVSDVPSNNAGDTVEYSARCSIVAGNLEEVDEAIVNVQQPPPVTHNLQVVVQGNGSVFSNPAGINCEPNCFKDYDQGTQVTLTADPQLGARIYWTGDCGTYVNNQSITCTMNTDKTVNVRFLECQPNKPCCGDGYCDVENGESHGNCPADCGFPSP